MKSVRLLATLLVVIVALAGCATEKGVAITPAGNTKRQFESAIARSILAEVRLELPQLKGSARAQYLREKSDQFADSVNLSLVSSAVFHQQEILKYLTVSEEARWLSTDFLARVTSSSSLDWTLPDYEQQVQIELDRLDQTIAVLAAEDPLNGFDLSDHMQSVRAQAEYPENSFDGRQVYMDGLAEAMFDTQLDWHDIFGRYEASTLGITGTETSHTTFSYNGDTIKINLKEVRDLPLFELKSIAIFYGFPGLQSFDRVEARESLEAVLHLPGYTLGWASYILDYIATRDVASTRYHLYFSRLFAGLALADLRVHSGVWSNDEAIEHLFTTTPYSRHRIRLMLNVALQEPGYYLAALAGKLKFTALQNQCPASRRICDEAFHQAIIDHGPLPFDMLERRLKALGLIQ